MAIDHSDSPGTHHVNARRPGARRAPGRSLTVRPVGADTGVEAAGTAAARASRAPTRLRARCSAARDAPPARWLTLASLDQDRGLRLGAELVRDRELELGGASGRRRSASGSGRGRGRRQWGWRDRCAAGGADPGSGAARRLTALACSGAVGLHHRPDRRSARRRRSSVPALARRCRSSSGSGAAGAGDDGGATGGRWVESPPGSKSGFVAGSEPPVCRQSPCRLVPGLARRHCIAPGVRRSPVPARSAASSACVRADTTPLAGSTPGEPLGATDRAVGMERQPSVTFGLRRCVR